ncbi:hypothetical protein Pcinc_036652 [Petrolisthes cinctipes]|uniref:Uncharacterized protein n=1 Tax=Petrolisthes cinctipes TaxID=88211 RepID=A0AAE1BTZ1_PETCI|nr:hypothetical protein Pcinc_036652 [Petrolisthes cinctipes]
MKDLDQDHLVTDKDEPLPLETRVDLVYQVYVIKWAEMETDFHFPRHSEALASGGSLGMTGGGFALVRNDVVALMVVKAEGGDGGDGKNG